MSHPDRRRRNKLRRGIPLVLLLWTSGATYGWGGPAVEAASASYAQAVLGDHPAAYWQFGDPVGSSQYADSSGNLNTLPSGQTSLATPGLGNADGAIATSGGTSTTSVLSPLVGDAPRTVEVWFKTTSGGCVLNVGTGAHTQAFSLCFAAGPANSPTPGSPGFYLQTWDADIFISLSAMNDGNWHYLGLTLNLTTVNIVIDGQQPSGYVWDGSAYGGLTAQPFTLPFAPDTAPTDLGVGTSGWTGGLSGTIDEVAIYGSALPPSELIRHYAYGGFVSTPGSPGPPTQLGITAGNGDVTVTWEAPSSPGTSPITGYTVTATPVAEAPHLDPPNNAVAVTADLGPGSRSAVLRHLVADCHQLYAITVTTSNSAGTGVSVGGGPNETVRPSGILPSTGADPALAVVLLDGIGSAEPDDIDIVNPALGGAGSGGLSYAGINYCPEDVQGNPTGYSQGGMTTFFKKWNLEESTPVSRAAGSPATPLASCPSSCTNRFMLDPLAALGTVFLPYSYTGASLSRSPDGSVLFNATGYSSSDAGGAAGSVVADPNLWVGLLQAEIASIHRTWPSTPIVLMGHSQGGFIAEQYWERKFHDGLSDGVTHIFSLDSPVNGVAAAPPLIGIFGYWNHLWEANLRPIEGGRDNFLSQYDIQNAGGIYIPIATRYDPVYNAKYKVSSFGEGFDAPQGALTSEAFLGNPSSCGEVETCPVLPPSFVPPAECDVNQTDMTRQFAPADPTASSTSDTGHFVVKYCPGVASFIDGILEADELAATLPPRGHPGPGGLQVLDLAAPQTGPVSLTAGSTVRVTGDAFAPGTKVTLTFHSDPISVTATADPSGWLNTVVTLPASVTTGSHQVEAAGMGLDGKPRTLSMYLMVSAQPSFPILLSVFVVLGLLVVSTGTLIGVQRRRRKSAR